MRWVKPIFLAVLTVALAAYAFDCGAATTPEQAMDCCNSMHCSSGGHGAQDCCATMPAMHSPFVQPASASGVSSTVFVFAVLPVVGKLHAADSSSRVIAAHCHAPPTGYSPDLLPLRI